MNCERNERATNRSVFVDAESTNLRWERANFTVQTMPRLAILAIFLLQYTDSDRRSNFWRIANRILMPLCKSNANCCIVSRKDVLEIESKIVSSFSSFFFFSFIVGNEYRARRARTNCFTEVTKYESSLKLLALFVLHVRRSVYRLFPLFICCYRCFRFFP